MKRAVIIVSNETLNSPVYIRDVPDTGFHVQAIKDFCTKYHLGITYESLEIEEGDVHGLQFHYALASLGHLVIIAGEMLLVFLPEYLSDRQYKWLKDNALFFKKNSPILEYGFISETKDLLANGTYETFYRTIEKFKQERELKL